MRPGGNRTGTGGVVHDPSAMVRNNDPVDAVIGRELCVLVGNDPLEDDFHLDGIAQALDQIPGEVRGVQAGGVIDVNAIIIRSSGDIALKTSAVTAIALPGIAAPQSKKRF